MIGGCKEDGGRFLSVVLGDRTRGKEYKLKHQKFLWNVKKKNYSEGVETQEKVVQ